MVEQRLEKAKLYTCQDMEDAEPLSVAGGTAVIYTTRSPQKQSANEDAAMLTPRCTESGILAVADGLGGVRAGGDAAALTMKTLISAVKNGLDDASLLRTAILNGIEAANQAVQDLGIGAATTLAVTEIQGENVRTYHVGDSMILVVGQRGKVKLQTTSHSPVGYGVEAGLLDEKEAIHHEDRHLVSNVIGSPDMRIEIGPVLHLAPRDTVLLASDGLFDNLHIEEVVERVRKGPLAVAVQRLAEDARMRMTEPLPGQPSKPDDLTILAYRRAWSSSKRSRASSATSG